MKNSSKEKNMCMCFPWWRKSNNRVHPCSVELPETVNISETIDVFI